MFTWFWWFWKTSSPASLFFHKIDDDCSHMLFLNLCFKISSPNGVLLFRWHLPQAFIHCSFSILAFWYYHLLFLLFLHQSLWCSITNLIYRYLCLSCHFILGFYCSLSIVVVLHLFTVHWFCFSMLLQTFF